MAPQQITLLSFIRFVRLVRSSIARPSDIPLAIRIGYFVLMIPRKLSKSDLPRLLREVRESQRPPAHEVQLAVERIIRLRRLWLWLPMLSSRNTCYVRALTLYRFLDSGMEELRIHFGVEPGVRPDDRLRGHAWITVAGEALEPPEPVLERRVRQIYSHPPGA